MESDPTDRHAPPGSRFPGGLTLAAFLLFVAFNGTAPVAVKFTYVELPPFWGGAMRFVAAAAVFWTLVLARRVAVPRGAALRGAILYGTLSVGLGPGLIFWGLVKTPASLNQTLMALIPLLTLFFATLHGQERITQKGLIGAALALGGIIIAIGGTETRSVSPPHVAAIIGAAACIAEAGVIAKGLPDIHPFATNAVGLTVGSVMMIAASRLTGETWILPKQPTTWIALIYIFLGMTVIGLFLFLYILETWTASATSYVFILAPLVTTVAAATLAKEAITPAFIGGAGLVVLGVYIGAMFRKRRPVETAPVVD